jgi:hypothetical protein
VTAWGAGARMLGHHLPHMAPSRVTLLLRNTPSRVWHRYGRGDFDPSKGEATCTLLSLAYGTPARVTPPPPNLLGVVDSPVEG